MNSYDDYPFQWMEEQIISLSIDELITFSFYIVFIVLTCILLFELPDLIKTFRTQNCKKYKKIVKSYKEKFGDLDEKM